MPRRSWKHYSWTILKWTILQSWESRCTSLTTILGLSRSTNASHRNGDELPRAYVVVKEGSKATPKDIASWMAERVSRHKRLDGGVIPVNEIVSAFG